MEKSVLVRERIFCGKRESKGRGKFFDHVPRFVIDESFYFFYNKVALNCKPIGRASLNVPWGKAFGE
jgi:hypothetical protein